MNKKLIVLILFVFLLISTVLICLIGMQPDKDPVYVQTLEFDDQTDGHNYRYEYIKQDDGTLYEDVVGVVININDLEAVDGKYVINYIVKVKFGPTDADIGKDLLLSVVNANYAGMVSFEKIVEEDGGYDLFNVTIVLDKKPARDIKIKVTSTDDNVGAEDEFVISLSYKHQGSIPK